MTIQEKRLYYDDSYLWDFTATITDVREVDAAWVVCLDRSAFYPTSGGQPNDTGWLFRLDPHSEPAESPERARVLDVFIENEQVHHKVDKPFAVGQPVRGLVDGKRRFDFMQQHCGQHILSRAFENVLDCETVSFHLGGEGVTIDLETPNLSAVDLASVERAANQVVFEDRPIRAQFIDPEDLEKFDLRRPPKVEKDIRIVSIDGFDDNACGGTHPRSTGQVGLIKILKTESMRGGTRLTFACGNRALADYEGRLTVLRELGQTLSTGVEEMVQNVQKLRTALMDTEKQLQEARQRLARTLAAEFFGQAVVLPDGYRYLTAVLSEEDAASAKMVMNELRELAGETPFIVGLAAPSGDRISLLLSSTKPDFPANEWFRAVVAPLGGKGGGNAQAAQGSILRSDEVTPEHVVAALHQYVSMG